MMATCLRGGAARVEITNDAKGTRVRDPLCAKALVLDDGTTAAVIVAMDTTAIGGRRISDAMLPDGGEDFLPDLRDRVRRELGIPGEHVLVNASHTHPPGRILCNDREQLSRTFDAVRRAARNMVPVRIGAGRGRENRFTINRTLRLADGRRWTIRHTNPCPPDEEIAGVGPIDPDIGVIRVDRLDGRPLAVVYNFACHPLFGDMKGAITANFPGVASRTIEERLGEGCTALFLQGAGGDICDIHFKDFERPRDVEPFGIALGLGALKALDGIRTGDARIAAVSATIRLPRRTDVPALVGELRAEEHELLESLRGTALNFRSFLPLYLKRLMSPGFPGDYPYRYLQEAAIGRDDRAAMDAINAANVEKYLANIRAMERLARIRDKTATLEKHKAVNDASGETTVAAEVQAVRLGECVLVSSPAEMTVEIGLRIKKASPCPFTFIASMSNGYLHYSPPAEDYAKGGYEVTECLLAPGWQKIYEKKAAELIGKLWGSVRSPKCGARRQGRGPGKTSASGENRKPQRAPRARRRG